METLVVISLSVVPTEQEVEEHFPNATVMEEK